MSLDLDYFKQALTEILKNSAIQGQLERELDDCFQGDLIDRTNNNRDNVLYLKLKGRSNFFIKKVQEALKKIEEGQFGICVECEEEIEERRLVARPTANFCLTCKEEMEQKEGQIIYYRRSHTHGTGIVNKNVVKLPFQNEEITKENSFKKRNIESLLS